MDTIKIVNAAPRIALSAQVNKLQTIKRDLEAVEVSECLAKAKGLLQETVEKSIDDILLFTDEKESDSKALMHGLHFELAMDECVRG